MTIGLTASVSVCLFWSDIDAALARDVGPVWNLLQSFNSVPLEVDVPESGNARTQGAIYF